MLLFCSSSLVAFCFVRSLKTHYFFLGFCWNKFSLCLSVRPSLSLSGHTRSIIFRLDPKRKGRKNIHPWLSEPAAQKQEDKQTWICWVSILESVWLTDRSTASSCCFWVSFFHSCLLLLVASSLSARISLRKVVCVWIFEFSKVKYFFFGEKLIVQVRMDFSHIQF